MEQLLLLLSFFLASGFRQPSSLMRNYLRLKLKFNIEDFQNKTFVDIGLENIYLNLDRELNQNFLISAADLRSQYNTQNDMVGFMLQNASSKSDAQFRELKYRNDAQFQGIQESLAPLKSIYTVALVAVTVAITFGITNLGLYVEKLINK